MPRNRPTIILRPAGFAHAARRVATNNARTVEPSTNHALVAISVRPSAAGGQFSADPTGHPRRSAARRSLVHVLQTASAGDNVAQISTRADSIQGTFRQSAVYQPDPAVTAKTVADFSTVIPAFADPGLESLLAAHGGTINARPLDQPANPDRSASRRAMGPPEVVWMASAWGGKPYGATMADAIDAEVERLLKDADSEAKRLLEIHRRELDGLAAALLEHETLNEPAIRRATGLLVIPRVAPLPRPTAVGTSSAR
jgi:Peptidase family M41